MTTRQKEAILGKLKPSIRLLVIATFIFVGTCAINVLLEGVKLQGEQTVSNKIVIRNVEDELQSINSKIGSNNEITSKLLTKDSFIDFMGKSTDSDNLKVTKFKSGTPKIIGGMSQINFILEVKGSPESLSKFVSDLEGLKVGYKLNAISYKKDGDVLWNKRNMQGDVLDWAVFTEATGSSEGKTTKTSTTTVESLMRRTDSYLYLDLDFITKV